jgi:hypothetical protein
LIKIAPFHHCGLPPGKSAEAALKIMKDNLFDAVVLGIKISGGMDALKPQHYP